MNNANETATKTIFFNFSCHQYCFFDFYSKWIYHNDTPIFLITSGFLFVLIALFILLKRVFNDVLATYVVFFILASPVDTINYFYYLMALLSLLALFKIKQTKINYVLNWVFSGLLIFNSVMGVLSILSTSDSEQSISKDFSSLPVLNAFKTAPPSIIHIVLDGYAGFQTLQTEFNYDNTPFKASLEKRGFNVVDAIAPYNITQFSMGAILNGGYYQNLAINKPIEEIYDSLNGAFNTFSVIKTLRAVGYSMYYVHNSIFVFDDEHIKPLTTARRNFSLLTSLLVQYAHLTEAPNFVHYYFNDLLKDALTLDVRRLKGHEPFYLYFHLIAPHPPFTLDENGQFTRENETQNGLIFDAQVRHGLIPVYQEKYKKGYLQKLKYTNKALLALIDRIQNQIEGDTIILLHGDHGSRKSVSFLKPSKHSLPEAFTTILAVYSTKTALSDALHQQTPFNLVNLYRAIFNQLSVEQFSYLDSKTYFVTPKDNQLRLQKISLTGST